ncbi:rhomboid-like protein [Streptomyces sp. NPDC001046]|uniref:rhomboid-like protein n=1 Tax=Streptomyces sp. NPDC001046 TaxID=3364543 RepID=UPI0036B3320F
MPGGAVSRVPPGPSDGTASRAPADAPPGEVADRAASRTPADAPPPLDGVPRQRCTRGHPDGGVRPEAGAGEAAPAAGSRGTPVAGRRRSAARGMRPWRLLPTPAGTPFTFWYTAVLCATALIAERADPALVHALLQGSSTDVAHLVRTPELVLVGSALWVAGGVASPFTAGFVLVLTALERRVGGLRTAGVFLLGHVVATLATEVPVGLAVLAGGLPGSSLHRLDYGVSFGAAAACGALAGLLPLWLRLPLLTAVGGTLLEDLLAFTDPMTAWGHLIALLVGIATWPAVRRWHAARRLPAGARREAPQA